jgi:hypothetical protein
MFEFYGDKYRYSCTFKTIPNNLFIDSKNKLNYLFKDFLTREVMNNKKLSGEVFYPSESVIEKAHIKNWEELDKKAKKDYPASGRKLQMNFIGLKSGKK